MSENSLGMSSGARMFVFPPSSGRRSPRQTALIVLRAIFLVATVALFFVWLTSAGTGGRGGGNFGDADCVSLGKGGVRCGPAAGNGGRNQVADARKDCTSLGRGGLVCGGPAK
jgi:hypothetical protein